MTTPLALVLEGGSVIDGTGTQAKRVDIGIADDRIVEVGDLSRAIAVRRIDVSNRVVTPGFVDIHTHSDLSVLSDGRARSKVMQGVTTEVVGNCGFSPFPSPESCQSAIRESVALIDVDHDVPWQWQTFEEYLEAIRQARPALNIAPMVGHIPLRVATSAFRSDADQVALCKGLDATLRAGAWGFSVGLMYPPSMWASRNELVTLAQVTAAHGRLFAVHMRDYGDRILEAVEETLSAAAQAGVRVQVSHLAVAGRRNWGKVRQALELIDAAFVSGVDVAIDIYPYLAGSANLSQLLPDWAQTGNPNQTVKRLADQDTRKRILSEWVSNLRFGWDEVEISSMPSPTDPAIGRSIAQIAADLALSGGEAALQLIEQSGGLAQMIAYGRSEDDLISALRYHACVIGSDGLALDPDGQVSMGRPHPRSFGTYPRLFGTYVREHRVLELERAVHMATSAPAARIGLPDRGRIAKGCFADVCVFDPASIRDLATFQDPKRFSQGIDHVFVNGIQVVDDGRQLSDRRPGRVLTCA